MSFQIEMLTQPPLQHRWAGAASLFQLNILVSFSRETSGGTSRLRAETDRVSLSVSSQLKAGEGGLEAQPAPSRDQVSAWFTQPHRHRSKPGWDIAFATVTPLHPAAPAFTVLLTEFFPWPSSSLSPSICHTPFLILMCQTSFKGSGLPFWIPGLIYSSRNMYLYSWLLPVVDLLWRVSGGLPSKILNEAKLLPLHFLKGDYRIPLQQLTLQYTTGYQNLQETALKKSKSPLPTNISGQAVPGGRGTTPQSSEHTERGPTKSNLSIHC